VAARLLARLTCCPRARRFVTRVSPKDANAHTILKIQSIKPGMLSTQIGLSCVPAAVRRSVPSRCPCSPTAMWGAFKYVIDIINKAPDGHYVLMRDANKVWRPRAALSVAL
jgi:hypothetical protein